jgi:hypothetical protein
MFCSNDIALSWAEGAAEHTAALTANNSIVGVIKNNAENNYWHLFLLDKSGRWIGYNLQCADKVEAQRTLQMLYRWELQLSRMEKK